MADTTNVGGRDRLLRGVLAVVFTVLAISAFRNGKRARGLLVGLAAMGFGFNVVTQFCGLNRALGIDTTSE
ncbi:MAG: DUF2892 domain-containing protein [Halobacteriales archaeon]|nr:DUF2892 domain-containing protein [Halobacteriales archaeon]